MDARRPQRCGRTVPSVGAPVLAVQSLRGFDGVDNTAAKFLLQQALKKKKEEEEEEEERKAKFEEKMLVVNRRVRDGTATSAEEAAWRRWMGLVPGSSPSSSGKRRKRKKKRKRKLPKSSSGVRFRRCGQGFPSRSSFSGAQCSLLLTTGPRCSTSWTVRNRRTVTCSSCARLVFLAILHFALCFLPCLQARDARHHGRHGPQDSYVEVHRCSSWTRSLTCPLVCYDWRHGPDSAENCGNSAVAVHHGRRHLFRCAEAVPLAPDYSVDHTDFTVVRIWWSMSLFAGSFLVVVLRQIPWSRLSVGPFSSPVNTVADVPVVQVVLAIPVVVNDRCARLRLCRKLLSSRRAMVPGKLFEQGHRILLCRKLNQEQSDKRVRFSPFRPHPRRVRKCRQSVRGIEAPSRDSKCCVPRGWRCSMRWKQSKHLRGQFFTHRNCKLIHATVRGTPKFEEVFGIGN